ncbi:N-terminal acetyltransferase [Elasticomyces elasticus]|nr:N-terminal acetyltransferase [Elasticomyces elasticus]
MSLFGGDGDAAVEPAIRPNAGLHRDGQSFSSPSATEQHSGEDRAALSGTESGDETSHTSEAESEANRKRSHPRTWLHYTDEERTLARALQQIEASDLSAHLYNFHALRSRSRSRRHRGGVQPWQRKESWAEANENGENVNHWLPQTMWTAWPLEPGIVPRSDGRFGENDSDRELDLWSFKKQEDWKPSRELEDEMTALILSSAMVQWHSREWKQDEVKRHVYLAAKADIQTNTTVDDGSSMHLKSRSTSRAVSQQSSGALSAASTATGSDENDSDVVIENEHNSMPTEPYPDWSSRPVPLADDQKARRILQPTVRHELQNIDNLLMGLHRNRQNHCRRKKEPRSTGRQSSRSMTRVASEPLDKGAIDRTTRPPKERNVVEYSIYAASDQSTASEDTNNGSPTSQSSIFSEQPKSHKRRASRSYVREQKAHLQDWSEVLGIASMVGWDTSVIERAASRCAALFGEGMSFRTLQPGCIDRTTEALKEGRPETIPPLDLSDDDTSEVGMTLGNPLVCPHESCPRHKLPYQQRGHLLRHLRRGHDNLDPRGRTILYDWDPPILTCPHTDTHCTVARSGRIYPERHRLIEHMQKSHDYDPRFESPPPVGVTRKVKLTPMVSETEEDEDNFLVGGVHNDGFMQPIRAKPGARGSDKIARLNRGGPRGKSAEGREEIKAARELGRWEKELERREAKRKRLNRGVQEL